MCDVNLERLSFTVAGWIKRDFNPKRQQLRYYRPTACILMLCLLGYFAEVALLWLGRCAILAWKLFSAANSGSCMIGSPQASNITLQRIQVIVFVIKLYFKILLKLRNDDWFYLNTNSHLLHLQTLLPVKILVDSKRKHRKARCGIETAVSLLFYTIHWS